MNMRIDSNIIFFPPNDFNKKNDDKKQIRKEDPYDLDLKINDVADPVTEGEKQVPTGNTCQCNVSMSCACTSSCSGCCGRTRTCNGCR